LQDPAGKQIVKIHAELLSDFRQQFVFLCRRKLFLSYEQLYLFECSGACLLAGLDHS
jgi:hypothetical protein